MKPRDTVDPDSPIAPGITSAAGEMGSVARDLPSIQIIRSPEIKHTDQDIPDWVPEAGLEAVARAYAKVIDEVNQLDRAALRPERPTDGQ